MGYKKKTNELDKFPYLELLYHTIPLFNTPQKEGFRKHFWKGEKAGDQHFPLFLECFLFYIKGKFRYFIHSIFSFFTMLSTLVQRVAKMSGRLKAFANDKSNVNQNLKFVLGRVENIVGKKENAGYQHFLLLPSVFFLSVIESRDFVVQK